MKERRNKRGFSVMNLVTGIVLVFHALILIILLTWALSTAFKSKANFRDNNFGFPDFNFYNIVTAIESFTTSELKETATGIQRVTTRLFPEIISYTLLYTVGGAFFAALVPCVMGYMVAKFNNVVSKFLYGLVIITMIIPIVGNQPSMIKVLDGLNLFDTIYGTWIMRAHFLNMYFLVFLATFKSLPTSYMEAAYIDGASEWRVMLRIMMPLVKTIFFTVMLLVFVELWNDYGTPLIYMQSYPTMAYRVYILTVNVGTETANMPFKMAACALLIIPTTTIFIVFKDKLMGNLSMGGIKG